MRLSGITYDFLDLQNNEFIGNQAVYGGAIYSETVFLYAIFNNTSFENNSAVNGGAIYCFVKSLKFLPLFLTKNRCAKL